MNHDHYFPIFLAIVLFSLFFAGVSIADDKNQSFSRQVEQAPTTMKSLPHNKKIKTLLDRYKPRVYVAPNSYLPMKFYRDYLPQTVLKNNQREIVQEQVNRTTLQKFSEENDYFIDYQRTETDALAFTLNDVQPTFYGRAYADTLVENNDSIPLLFLKYSTVFPYSGLPYGNSWWKNTGAWLAGNPWGWHELDIHGAIYVILHRPSLEPIGIMLSQHNHQKVHLRNQDFQWPEHNQISVSYAVRSNEPYLLSETMRSRLEPTVGNPSDIKALYQRSWIRPLSAGYDRVIAPEDGARKIPMRLSFLALDDPLYTSHMDLGDRRLLFGYWRTWFRDGPPGINYYAPPSLKNMVDLAAFWDIERGDHRFFKQLESLQGKPQNIIIKQLLAYQKEQFYQEIKTVLSTVEGSP